MTSRGPWVMEVLQQTGFEWGLALQGFFSADELAEVMRAMGGNPTPAELDAVMYELDANNDRNVDFAEFLAKFYVSGEVQQGAQSWGCCALGLSFHVATGVRMGCVLGG